MIKRNKIIISGRVQEVFFRRFVYEHAIKLRLKGYVKNTEDGNVEAVFEGDEDKIKKIIEICKKGPPTAKVESIKILEEEVRNEKEFIRKN